WVLVPLSFVHDDGGCSLRVPRLPLGVVAAPFARTTALPWVGPALIHMARPHPDVAGQRPHRHLYRELPRRPVGGGGARSGHCRMTSSPRALAFLACPPTQFGELMGRLRAAAPDARWDFVCFYPP